jgi:hypothetical protein
VYFLADRENPTRTFFDYFDEPEQRENRILAAIRQHDVGVVVINTAPDFSGKIASALYDSLSLSFPKTASVGAFEVRWK